MLGITFLVAYNQLKKAELTLDDMNGMMQKCEELACEKGILDPILQVDGATDTLIGDNNLGDLDELEGDDNLDMPPLESSDTESDGRSEAGQGIRCMTQ